MRRTTFRDRLYRLLLRAFPAEFRGDFGRDMEADFREEHADASTRGLTALCALWVRTLLGIVATAMRVWIDDFVTDLRHASRTMRRSPYFTAAAILMLALGSGANVAVFSVVDAVLFRSPFADPKRLVMVDETNAGQQTAAVTVPQFERLRPLPFFAAVGALWGGSAVITGNGEPYSQAMECLTAGVFEALGTPARFGRVLNQADDRVSASPVVVLSDALWKDRFGANPAIVGHVIYLNGTAATIVGIMPPRFLGPFTRNSTKMWAPLGPALGGTSALGCRAAQVVNVVARLAPQFDLPTASAAAAESNVIAGLPDSQGHLHAKPMLVSLDAQTFDGITSRLVTLTLAVGAVLLIACANVAGLQLERLVGRRREISLRFALGATRSRVIRQLLAENLLLAAGGALAGSWIAWAALPAIVSLMPGYMPHLADVRVRADVLAVATLVTLAAVLALAIVPVSQTTGRRFVDGWRGGTTSTPGPGQWPRRALVVGELALATALLVAAGLTVKTFQTLSPTAPGFDPSNKLVASVWFGSGPASSADSRRIFVERMLARLRAVPGVRAVDATTYLPLSGNISTGGVVVHDRRYDVWMSRMTAGYLQDARIPIVQGRAFLDTDGADAPAVAIVNERAAQVLWPQQSAVGQTMTTLDPVDGHPTTRRIIGVARNTRSLGGSLKVQLEAYVPYPQDPVPMIHFVLSTSGPAAADLGPTVRRIVDDERPGQVVQEILPFADIVGQSVSTWRFGAWLFGAFGALAAVLAALGLSAIVLWWVAQRTREIGVRMALGASAGDVVLLIVRQVVALAGAGIAAGVALGIASTHLLAGWIYGLSPLDVRTFVLGATAMLAIALVTGCLPAYRAARVDPAVTLKTE
jgi:putative ABC transport system permease protein